MYGWEKFSTVSGKMGHRYAQLSSIEFYVYVLRSLNDKYKAEEDLIYLEALFCRP